MPGERLQIRYEDTTLPGHFSRAPDAEPGEPRPLVVLNNGSDGATSHMGLFGGWAALERGYHAMTFDGPGQPAALFRQGIPFRHDWEAVLTPVVDAMAARPTSTPTGSPWSGSPRPAPGSRDPSPSSIASSPPSPIPGCRRLHFRGNRVFDWLDPYLDPRCSRSLDGGCGGAGSASW